MGYVAKNLDKHLNKYECSSSLRDWLQVFLSIIYEFEKINSILFHLKSVENDRIPDDFRGDYKLIDLINLSNLTVS